MSLDCSSHLVEYFECFEYFHSFSLLPGWWEELVELTELCPLIQLLVAKVTLAA